MPASEINILTRTFGLEGTVAARRFLGYTMQTAGLNANAVGVTRNGGDQGDLAAVTMLGTVIVEAGDTIDPGEALGSDASGRAVPVNGTTVTTVLARAMQSAADAGSFLEVSLIPN